MDKPQVNKKNDDGIKASRPLTKQSQPEPSSDSPMGKFNKSHAKILPVPKKNLKDK